VKGATPISGGPIFFETPMNLRSLLVAVLALSVAPLAATAAEGNTNTTMACSVSVTYSRNRVAALTYVRDFVLDPTTPYFEDFSTPLRSRFFSATVADDNGTPVVSIVFDADVDVFNAIDFGTSLRVRDTSKGETASGNNTFFAGGALTATHRSDYTLTCKKAF